MTLDTSNRFKRFFAQAVSKRPLVVILLVFIVFSMGLRLWAANLNIYFDKDEVRKLMRTSGFTAMQFQSYLTEAEPMPISDFVDRYQYACSHCPDSPSLGALKANREHPPLYYVLLQRWLRLFGQWVGPKMFATLVTLATLPVLYWLTIELFEDRLAGLIALAFFSVSPLMFTVSQHVSQYSLLSLLSCLSTILFIRAHRSQKTLGWGLYSFSVGLGLYTHLFFILLPVAHGLYEFIRWNPRRLRSFLLAIAIASLSFWPWIAGILNGYHTFEETTGMATAPILENPPAVWTYFTNGVKFTVQLFLKKSNISLLSNDWLANNVVSGVAVVIFVGITVWLVRRGSASAEEDSPARDSFLLLLACLWVPTIPIMILDTFLVQGISAKVRYYLPTIMLLLPLLGLWISLGVRSSFSWRRRWVSAGLLLLLTVSLASTGKLFLLSLSNRSSEPQYGLGYQQAANVANQVVNPQANTLIISYENYIQSLIFSHRLNNDIDYLVHERNGLSYVSLKAEVERYRDRYGEIFIFSPSQKQVEKLDAANLTFKAIPEQWNSPVLYQILPSAVVKLIED